MNKSVGTMQRRVRKLQEELGQIGPVMRGSVVVIGTRNKQPYFSLNKDKRTRLIYLGQKRVAPRSSVTCRASPHFTSASRQL